MLLLLAIFGLTSAAYCQVKTFVFTTDKAGPVEVILESSTDMKHSWEKAALGAYGAIDTKRFFRLKAILKQP